ncbi:MAG TPA: ABC transporter ATP-binding protein [Homoserinimonas sp.]|nr:ABC transporter ATP-binding protein [Homoserinimonas sp.]
MTSGARVSARGWGWRYAGRRAAAVSELTMQIEPGERVLLLGASGAGKSTVLHALAGVLGGDDDGDQQGELLIDGRRPQDARGLAGLVLQDPDSQVVLARIGDDVAFGCENLGLPRDETWRRVASALDAVGLRLPLDYPTSALSGGQKQRLALAGVLAMEPRLVLLDEPTANLDPAGVIEVRDAVARTIAETGATLIVIEHRVAVWRDLVDRVIVLDAAGGVLADGAPADVLASEGRRLADAGVWVPEFPPAVPSRSPWSASEPLLQGSALGVGRRKNVVASGIDVSVSSGQAIAVSGPNGSGKSTLALTLAGLVRPLAGELTAVPALAAGVGGQPIRWKSRQLLTRIGTVFQDPEHQFLSSTVRDELAVGPRALRLPEREVDERVDDLLDRLRLTGLARANPFTLSGGEKRRLSVATILAARPRVLVLDEPTFGQDSRTWRELVALLAELLDEGKAVVAVTHDRDFIDALADRELVLA